MRTKKSPLVGIALIVFIALIIYYYVGIDKATQFAKQEENLVVNQITDPSGQVIGTINFVKPPTPPVPDYSNASLNQYQPAAQQPVSIHVNASSVNKTSTYQRPNFTIGQVNGFTSANDITTNTINGIPTYQISQRVYIKPIVTVYDPATLNSTNPRMIPGPYTYSMQITCAFRDNCLIRGSSTFSTHGDTNTDGSFIYILPTDANNETPGLYQVTVTCISATQDSSGTYYEMTGNYEFQLTA